MCIAVHSHNGGTLQSSRLNLYRAVWLKQSMHSQTNQVYREEPHVDPTYPLH